MSQKKHTRKKENIQERTTSSKVFAALGAEEVVRMPGPAQGVDALIADGAIAVRALGGEEVVEALLAVGARVLLEEGGGAQGLATLEAAEALWVPGLSKGGDNLPQNGLLAPGALALEFRVNANLVHLRAERVQDVVKLILSCGGGRLLLFFPIENYCDC